jgi:hypothetical protein
MAKAFKTRTLQCGHIRPATAGEVALGWVYCSQCRGLRRIRRHEKHDRRSGASFGVLELREKRAYWGRKEVL